MAKNEKVKEYKKLIKHNQVEGDLRVIVATLIEEIEALRDEIEAMKPDS